MRAASDYDFSPETPTLGTVRRVADGKPGSVLNYYDYPLTAVCVHHGRPIRCDSYSDGGWRHLDDDPRTIRDIAAGMDLRSPRKAGDHVTEMRHSRDRSRRITAWVVAGAIVLCGYLAIRVGMNEMAKHNPPDACQFLGGSWDFWNGWRCA